jgi:hypothetical protein
MTGADMPGESLWIPYGQLRSVRGMADVAGSEVRVVGGEHKGKAGVVRQHDGQTGLVQIRTGDPKAWQDYDAETRRMMEERGW